MIRTFLQIDHVDDVSVQNIFTMANALKTSDRSVYENCLQGVGVCTMFFEPSTRTKASFYRAANELGATVFDFNSSDSSMVKGESLKDTMVTLHAMGYRVFIIRIKDEQKVMSIVDQLPSDVCVLSAGMGCFEHPSQALLDAFTILEMKKSIKGQNVLIMGDVLRSRVAQSNIKLLKRLGANVGLFGPKILLPSAQVFGVNVFDQMDQALKGQDVIMVLRVQDERLGVELNLSEKEYFEHYGLTAQRLKLASKDAMVMHPGPFRRGFEISSDVADGSQSVILKQVSNGVWIRMALLRWMVGL